MSERQVGVGRGPRFRRSAALLVVSLVGPLAVADEPAETVWKETTRDVWVDGTLDRGAVVMRAADPPRLALFATRTADAAHVLDLDASTIARESGPLFDAASSTPSRGQVGRASR